MIDNLAVEFWLEIYVEMWSNSSQFFSIQFRYWNKSIFGPKQID